MTNPLRAVIINRRYYPYLNDSFRESINSKNSVSDTQTNRNFSVAGKSLEDFSVTIRLENEYEQPGAGNTTWLGVSRLHDLKNYWGANGVSLPITFVTPYGATFLVVPTGSLDISIFNPENPSEDSAEFDVNLSFAGATRI